MGGVSDAHFARLGFLGLLPGQAADMSACAWRSRPRVKVWGDSSALFARPTLLVAQGEVGGGGGQQRLLRSRCSACASWRWWGVGGRALTRNWWQSWGVGGSASVLGHHWDGGGCMTEGLLQGNVVRLLALARWWGGAEHSLIH